MGGVPISAGPPRFAACSSPLQSSDVGVVDDAIDGRGGRGSIGENRGPFAQGQVGGEDETAAFVATTDDLEKQVGGAGIAGRGSRFRR